MSVLFRPDDTTLTAIAPLFAGNTSSPVIHRIETARDHIQALYWVRILTCRMCKWNTVRRNVLGTSLGESSWSV